MVNVYRVTRNIASGNEDEYRILKELAEECGAVSIEDEIDLDSYDYPLRAYAKYYLQFEFANVIDRDIFVMKVKRINPSIFRNKEA